VHCDEAQTPPAAAAAAGAETFKGETAAAAAAAVDTGPVPATPQWCEAESQPAQPVIQETAGAAAAAAADAELVQLEVTPLPVESAAAEAVATASKQCVPVVPLLQLSAVVPPLHPLMRISVSSAASTARGEAESIFNCIDQEQQQRVSSPLCLYEHCIPCTASSAALTMSSSSG
jgi:hypothetical protein